LIRNVAAADVADITEIYNHYIRETTVTFEEESLSDEEMAVRIHHISLQYPYIVFEESGRVVGYAYATRWKERSAYRNSAETTVYVHKDSVGRGIGKQLYHQLIELCKQTNLHYLIGGITMPNDASVKLHESLGFKYVGTFKEVGYKFEKWLDVGYWGRRM
jgi:phosphinothricin acetyltransferase